jgi:hypothetical protein
MTVTVAPQAESFKQLVTELYGDQPPASNGHTAPAPSTTGWQQHEPPFVHSLKWLDADTGIEHMTVVRASTMEQLWAQVRTVVQMVKKYREQQPTCTDQQVNTPRRRLLQACPSALSTARRCSASNARAAPGTATSWRMARGAKAKGNRPRATCRGVCR